MPVIIRIDSVIGVTGLSKSSIYAFERAGTFPKRIKLGARAVGWDADEVAEWVKARKASV
ncbi:helix-turn-helix transcriptional regulator [Paracoccus pantotrophus]|uniref:helix-turn-helix transcriptional regulator n=1 Tax=Paracoccus pantotrophus TaxID=82367 RepID=UPI000F429F31|nr:AlpA family phage regulatory protein [Paracoccus pantotrophus]RNI20985.1 AlpA family phage regulatory protein [Paracoccus pantotrophus]